MKKDVRIAFYGSAELCLILQSLPIAYPSVCFYANKSSFWFRLPNDQPYKYSTHPVSEARQKITHCRTCVELASGAVKLFTVRTDALQFSDNENEAKSRKLYLKTRFEMLGLDKLRTRRLQGPRASFIR
jgi:hypothetical protein